MRKKRTLLIATILLFLLGVAAILVGIFAYRWGLDNNAIMGPKRKAMVGLGIAFLIWRPVLAGVKKLALRWHLPEKGAAFSRRFAQTCFGAWWCGEEQPRSHRHDWLWAAAACLIVIVVAIWYITAGTLTQWTPYTHYFDLQADGYLAGQLSLAEQPPAELDHLTDLYNWRARVGINYLWDASYYHGKYYLYWGPVPALLATAIKLIHAGVVDDQILLMIFFSGLVVVLAALFYWLRKLYFKSAPAWTVFLFTLASGLATPIFFLVNRPSVYETAIAAAQCFLLLGIYAALRALSPASGKKAGWLLLAGFSLGASVGARFSYAPTVVAISLVIGILLLRDLWVKKHGWLALVAYGLPLLLIAVGIAWYNDARFGSIFESGIRYQLTGDALPANLNLIYSAGYVLPNAYSDLLRPLWLTRGSFPYLTTPPVQDNMWPNFVHRPPTYYSGEPVAGILVTIPWLWLLFLPVFRWARQGIDWINEKPQTAAKAKKTTLPAWILWVLVLATLVQIGMSFSFVMTTMRYLVDFTPLLLICAALLTWAAYERIERPSSRKLFLILVIFLCLASIAISLLVNMQTGDQRFQLNNPHLYGEIATFFQGHHAKLP